MANVRRLSPLFLFLSLLLLASCGKESTPVDPGGNDTSRSVPKTTAVLTFNLETVAGDEPFALGRTMTSQGGVQYRLGGLKFFVSQPWLVTEEGDTVHPKLLDSALHPWNYNLMIVDYERPSTLALKLLARPATYRQFGFTIGVPVVGDDGDSLNHGDASLRQAPLDVDNGMYWSWNPGYIFLKVEGGSLVDGAWQQLFYHVGNDDKRMPIFLDGLSVKADTSDTCTATLRVNVNRLFVNIFGQNVPNIGGSLADRTANSGSVAMAVAKNVTFSGFISFKQ
jgi:hypothetical protein